MNRADAAPNINGLEEHIPVEAEEALALEAAKRIARLRHANMHAVETAPAEESVAEDANPTTDHINPDSAFDDPEADEDKEDLKDWHTPEDNSESQQRAPTANKPPATKKKKNEEFVPPDPVMGDPTKVARLIQRKHSQGNRTGKELLSPEEEISLAMRIEKGDLEAKELFVEKNVRLVLKLARQYLGQGLEMDDLVQEGTLGLIRGVEKFDYRRGYKYSTYGTSWVRQALQRAIAKKSKTIRIPNHVEEKMRKVGKTQTYMATRLGREPNLEELSEVTEYPLEVVVDVIELIKQEKQMTSLDKPVNDQEGTVSLLGDFIPDEDEDTEVAALDNLEGREQHSAIEKAMGKLDEEEREVITLRFNLNGEEEETTVDAVGRMLGLPKARIRKIESSALSKLSRDDNVLAVRAKTGVENN